MIAAEGGHREIVRCIIEEYTDVDINKVDSKEGNTVLHHLAINGMVEEAKLVFDKNDRLALK